MEGLTAVFGGRMRGGSPNLILQVFDRRRVLSTRLSIVLAGDTFSRLADPGLILDSKAAAVLEGGRLSFRSFIQARRLFDLSVFYREATAHEVTSFVSSSKLVFDDGAGFVGLVDDWVRRKIALIHDSSVLDRVKGSKLSAVARKYKVSLSLRNGCLVIPSARAEMKAVLRFLEENYYTSELTGTKYLSNSKRRADA